MILNIILWSPNLSQVCSAKANMEVHLTDPADIFQANEENEVNTGAGEVMHFEGSPLKKNVFICENTDCGKVYRRKDSLADHQRIVHGAAKLKCQLLDCPALFSRRQFYLGHMWTKHGIGSGAKCDECGKREMTLGLLRKHRSDVHGAADLKCTEPGCQAFYNEKFYLRRHMWMEHGIGEGIKCGECGKRQSDPWHLRTHLRLVHGKM